MELTKPTHFLTHLYRIDLQQDTHISFYVKT